MTEPGLSSLGSRGSKRAQVGKGSAPSPCFRRGRFERYDKRTLFEEGVDNIHLDPLSFSMDDFDFPESSFLAFNEVIF